MSITRSVLMALVAVSALTVMAPGHAEAPTQEGQSAVYDILTDAKDRLQSTTQAVLSPVINTRELACLARNIFYEAGSEPEEGKVAVGIVTLNRVADGRFQNSICGVVNQRTAFQQAHTVKTERMVKTGYFTSPKKVTETATVWNRFTVCQFSWACMRVPQPHAEDQRWEESQRVAEQLLEDQSNYSDLREKYRGALYFHAVTIHPSWAYSKQRLQRIGGHIFYQERGQTLVGER